MTNKRHDGLRKFNRTIFNPIIKLFAGRFLYALVYHIGRHSGKEYATPVVATQKDEFVFIPLPYGANTDWFLNVQAKGKCEVMIRGKRYASIHPEIVDSTTALAAFPSIFQGAFERASINQYLRLRKN
jgi:deazaflavin-dependent oxidoreductase (nitroreductase family)